MNTFRFYGIIAQQFGSSCSSLFLVGQVSALHFGNFSADIGKDIECRIIVRFGEQVNPFIREFDGIILFIDHKKQLIINDVHVL